MCKKVYNFKVSFIPNIDNSECEFDSYHETIEEAVLVLNSIANYTLLLHDNDLMLEYSNMAMLYKNVDDEWIEIDEDGEEI